MFHPRQPPFPPPTLFASRLLGAISPDYSKYIYIYIYRGLLYTIDLPIQFNSKIVARVEFSRFPKVLKARYKNKRGRKENRKETSFVNLLFIRSFRFISIRTLGRWNGLQEIEYSSTNLAYEERKSCLSVSNYGCEVCREAKGVASRLK